MHDVFLSAFIPSQRWLAFLGVNWSPVVVVVDATQAHVCSRSLSSSLSVKVITHAVKYLFFALLQRHPPASSASSQSTFPARSLFLCYTTLPEHRINCTHISSIDDDMCVCVCRCDQKDAILYVVITDIIIHSKKDSREHFSS